MLTREDNLFELWWVEFLKIYDDVDITNEWSPMLTFQMNDPSCWRFLYKFLRWFEDSEISLTVINVSKAQERDSVNTTSTSLSLITLYNAQWFNESFISSASTLSHKVKLNSSLEFKSKSSLRQKPNTREFIVWQALCAKRDT